MSRSWFYIWLDTNHSHFYNSFTNKNISDDSANNEEDLEEDSDDEADQADELRDEVIAVYEQIRNLVVNMKRSKNIGQSISGSLHTSIASSDSGDNLTTQFRVKIRLISLCIVLTQRCS